MKDAKARPVENVKRNFIARYLPANVDFGFLRKIFSFQTIDGKEVHFLVLLLDQEIRFLDLLPNKWYIIAEIWSRPSVFGLL